jgi:hypothetical protein
MNRLGWLFIEKIGVRSMYFKEAIMGIIIFILSACVTTRNLGNLYFKKGEKVKGVEPYNSLLERMNKDQQLREIMYGQAKSGKIVQCTILRNQLYVAAMESKNAEILNAVKIMENSYQEDDRSFLMACDQILATKLGQSFLSIQQDYLRSNR